MRRLFAAFALPAAVRAALAARVRELAVFGDVRWTDADDFHLTLVFLGERDARQEEAVAAAVRAFRSPDLAVEVQQLGRFPERGEPRVLWAGLAGDLEALARVQRDLAGAIGRTLGDELAGAERFSPHVTIGRVRSARGLGDLVDAMQRVGPAVRGEPFRLGPVALFASERGSAVRYRELARGTLT